MMFSELNVGLRAIFDMMSWAMGAGVDPQSPYWVNRVRRVADDRNIWSAT